MNKSEFINLAVNRDMFGLEIGPSFNPSLPRAEGWNVEVVDHASADDLRTKYADQEGIDRIEHVDYISDARSLHEVIPRRGEYDFIFASHVVEHMTDLVGFLKSCDVLLKPTGKLVLVIPDKRRCFDVMQTRTTTGDLLEAHRTASVRHNPGRAFDFIANIVDLGGHGIWESDWARKRDLGFRFSTTIEDARTTFDRVASQSEYVDIHAWRFVPSSFRLIMQDLARLDIIKLKEDFIEDTNGCEFYFSASPSGSGCSLNRIELTRAIAVEEIEGLMQVAIA